MRHSFVCRRGRICHGRRLAAERISIDDNWRFTKGDPTNCAVSLLYDVRRQQINRRLAETEADGNSNVTDKAGLMAPRADRRIHFDIEGPGEIVVTDNGDPTSSESFQSHDRNAFNGLCMAIVCGKPGQPGTIKLAAKAGGLEIGVTSIETKLKAN